MTDITELQGLLGRSTQLLDRFLAKMEAGDELCESDEWMRCFGKDSAVSVLAKLVSMYRQLHEQQRLDEQYEASDAPSATMSDADWELLEQCVTRWRKAQGVENR